MTHTGGNGAPKWIGDAIIRIEKNQDRHELEIRQLRTDHDSEIRDLQRDFKELNGKVATLIGKLVIVVAIFLLGIAAIFAAVFTRGQ